VDVAVTTPGEAPWNRCYQTVTADSPPRSEALFVYLVLQPRPGGTELLVYAHNFVWLAGVRALDGRIGADEADRNLLQLSEFVRSFKDFGLPVRSIEAHVDGNPFRAEIRRIRDAFSGVCEVHEGW
jgi:hypothetical protein